MRPAPTNGCRSFGRRPTRSSLLVSISVPPRRRVNPGSARSAKMALLLMVAVCATQGRLLEIFLQAHCVQVDAEVLGREGPTAGHGQLILKIPNDEE